MCGDLYNTTSCFYRLTCADQQGYRDSLSKAIGTLSVDMQVHMSCNTPLATGPYKYQ